MSFSTALIAATTSPLLTSAFTATMISLPSCSVMRLNTRTISARPARNSRIAALVCASALCPTSSALTSIATNIATTTSSTPIASVPIASKIGLPVSTVSSTANRAKTRPSSAARSSPKMTMSSLWRLSRNQRHSECVPRALFTSVMQPYIEKLSATMPKASTPIASHGHFTGSGSCSLCRPS